MGRTRSLRSPRAEHECERHALANDRRNLILVPSSRDCVDRSPARLRPGELRQLRDADADQSQVRRPCAGQLLGHEKTRTHTDKNAKPQHRTTFSSEKSELGTWKQELQIENGYEEIRHDLQMEIVHDRLHG